jgi:hypothetical protein
MGSTYQPLLDYYESLKQQGVDITICERLQGDANALNSVSAAIERYKIGRTFDYYAVTDSDISLELAPSYTLDVYTHCLEAFPKSEIVGPMLKITDIPEGYPAREWAWKRHVDQFWHKSPEKFEFRGSDVYYQFAPIDTTFGVLRAKSIYRRLLSGIRVYHPYEALHLDWYITQANITEDQINYLKTSNPNIAHWCSSWYEAPPQERLLGEERNIFVVQGPDSNRPSVVRVKLP